MAKDTLLGQITKHYLNRVKGQIFRILLSADLLLPFTLASSVSTGVVDFIVQPSQGLLRRNPSETIRGLAIGSVALLKSVSSGLVNSFTRFVEAADFDPYTGFRPRSLWHGVLQGIAGTVVAPSKGFQQHGFMGLCLGTGKAVGRRWVKCLKASFALSFVLPLFSFSFSFLLPGIGVLGLVTKPLQGVINNTNGFGAAHAGHGAVGPRIPAAAASAQSAAHFPHHWQPLSGELLRRLATLSPATPPHPFAKNTAFLCLVLQAYNPHQAIGQEVLVRAEDGRFAGHTYIDHCMVHRVGIIIVITDR